MLPATLATLAMAALSAFAAAAPARAGDLADATLAIAGAKLTVSPESQTVPFDTPTEILTQLQGFDAAHGAVPANLLVLGDFTGPQISGVLTLQTVPGQPFQIPRLQTQGIYQLDNIRLMQGGNLLGYAQPRSAALTVTQVLVTSVTSRALTSDEIRSYGIAVDSSSMQAYVFTFAFAVAPGQTVSYDLPVVFNQTSRSSAPLPLYQALGQNSGGVHGGPRFTPPRMAPFQLTLAPAAAGGPGGFGGCMDLENDCSSNPPLPIPGVILFPTDVSLLHQFFSVILMVQNGAPTGDPLVLRDLSARVTLPPGLRQASTLPPTPLGVPVPIRVPGPDGILGTADDITFLVAQASGEAQVLAEGLEQGTQIVQFDIEGVVDGLPGGKLQIVTGQARGAVVVRDPTLNVTVTHPEVVRANEQYQLLLTVTNTGNSPANQLTLRLPPDKLAGVQVVGNSSQTIDLLPGDSQLVEFTLMSLLTGRVVADAVRSSAEITPTFDLSVGVGENDIPLSPNAIILPDAAYSLPPDLLRADLNLIGLGYSLATAPPSLLTQSSLPEVSLGAIDSRVYELAQAGVEVTMGEATFDSAAILAVLGTGAQDQDAAWDQLRRITQKGGSAGARLAAIFAAEAAATSPAAAFHRFAATTAFVGLEAVAAGGGGGGATPGVAGIEGALAVGAGATLQVASRASGLRLAGGGEDPARLRELPFADLYLLDGQGGSQMALLAVPEATGYLVQLRIAGGGTADLELLVPAADGSLRSVSWLGVALGAGGSATVTYAPGDAAFTLAVDPQGTGAGAQQLAGGVAALEARAFGVVAAMQNAAVDPTGHIVDVLFSGDVDRASLLPVDASHFQIPGKLSNGGLTQIDADIVAQAVPGPQGAQALHNSRLLRVVFNNPLSPYATPVELTVARVKSATGETLASAQLPVQITVTAPGEQVSGVVIGPDGQPVPFAEVTLHETDFCVVCDNQCNEHQTAIIKADSNGRYLFDYVRVRPECGDSFGLSATDPASDEVGVATGRVRFIAQTARLDVLMLGRGTIRGHVAYDDGTLPQNPQVVAYSPVFREWGNPTIDAYGNYSVSNVPVGTITLSATDGQGKFVITTLAVPTSGSVVDYDLIILRVPPRPVQTGQVRGQVVRPDGTTPVVLAYVALYVDGNLIGVERTDAGGNFDFGIVPAGQAEIDTFENQTGQSGVQVFFQLNPDQVNQVKLTMNPNRGAVEGHVYRQTGTAIAPIAGAVVWVEGQPFKTFTDAQGFYHLDGVFTGTWQVFAADLVTQASVSQAATIEAEGATATRDLYFQTQLPSGFAGQVLDFDGNPVAGATVHLAAGSLNWWGEAFTDATGAFSYSGLGPGSYGVHAFLGPAGGSAGVVIRFPGDTPFVTIRFKEGTIKGVVQAKDANGQVAGLVATVTYRTTVVREGLLGLALDPTTIQTAPDGTFEIDNVLAGAYQISAYNAFYGSQSVSGQIVNQGEVQTQTLTFQQNGPGTIKGIVLDQDGVTPAAGASVHLAHPAFSAYDLTTGADGSFEFDLVPPTPWGFPVQVIYQSGVIFRQAQVYVSFTQPGQTLTLQIVLPKQGSVAGLVEDADGHPVPGSVVTLAEGHYPYRQLIVNADANAAFQFSNVFAGPASLAARAPTLGGLGGKTAVTITNEGQALTGVLISLQPTGKIAGRVLSPVDGSAVPNAEVKLFTSYLFDTINADANGQFEFDLLPLGGYDVYAFDPATGRQGHTGGLVVASNDQAVPGDVTLEARGGVLGHLYDPDSTPPLGVPVATVALTSEGITSFITYSSTDLGGAFQFQGIPQGDFTLAAREPQGRRNAGGQGTIAHEGDQVTVDLTLQQEGTVTGSVLDPAGATSGKFPNVNVTVTQDGQIIGGVLASDYRFGGIVAGRPFELDAQEVGGHHAGSVRGTLADATPQELNVQMVPLGSVRVVVQDSFGTPVPGANVTLYTNGFYGYHVLNASSSATADAIFQDIGAGALGVEVYDPISTLYGSAGGTLTTDGEIVQLTAKLESTGMVRGTVLLADGVTPAVGATAGLQVGTRFFLVQTDGAGAFAFHAVPLGDFDLNFQQSFGPGTLEVLGAVTANGQVVDLGTLVLDATDLQVLSITPADGSTNVALTQTVAVAFNKPLDPNRNTLGAAVNVTRSDGQGWPMTASLSADGKTISLTPDQPFDNATTYLVRANPPVFAASGRVLQQPAQASFTTVDHLLPVVIHIDPAAGAVQVPLNAQLHLIFNRPIDPNSLSGSHLQLLDLTDNLQVTTTFTALVGGRELLVTPQTALLEEKQYQITVQGMVDLVGNVQAQPCVSTFYSLDTTPPRFGAVLPAAGTVYTAGDPVAITVAASDPSGVHDVSVQLGPRSADLTAPAGGSYQVTLAAPRVAAASDVPITIAATDVYGNVATMTRTIHVNVNPNQTGPAIATCLVEGDAVAPGVALSVPLTASDDQAVESYDLAVDGQIVTTVVSAGVPSASDAIAWTPPAGSAAGTTFAMRLDADDFAGNVTSVSFNLVVPAGTVLVGDQAIPASAIVAGQPLSLAHGKFTAAAPLAVGSLTLMQGATLAPAAPGQALAIAAAAAASGGGAPGPVRIQCGASIDLAGLGYPGGVPGHATGYAPPWVAGAPQDAGGSHGGPGINSGGAAGGPVFDSVYQPQLGGGGGSQENDFPGFAGAGAVTIDAGTLTLAGQIKARGIDGCLSAGSAGGAVAAHVGTLTGAGTIDVGGGNAAIDGCGPDFGYGAGGGGRVALYAGSVSGFSAAQVLTQGGALRNNGGFASPGTLLWNVGGETSGDLIVDAGTLPDGSARPVMPTPLPALGGGSLVHLVAAGGASGADAWASAAAPYTPEWLGATMDLLDASGNLLGSFQVTRLDASGRLLLAGAGAVAGATGAGAAASYRGEYRFDNVQLLHGAGLAGADPVVAQNVTLNGNTEVGAVVTAANLTVASGAVVKPAAGGSIHFVVSGTMTVAAGAVVDVSGLGYPGGVPGQSTGYAPPWVTGAPQDAGGSHGGAGIGAHRPGPGGPTFDSVYQPQLGGGGGSQENYFPGFAGGGTVTIDAGTLSLAGEIKARGIDGCLSAGSAGGSVLVRAGELDGAGTIDVSGGNAAQSGCATSLYFYGGGGGGRAAIYATTINGFAPVSQVAAGGGALPDDSAYAAPGTLLVRLAGQTYGDLYVDGGAKPDGTPLPATPTALPQLGSGALTALAPAGATPAVDAWVSAAAAFTPEWLGAWMDLLDASGNLLGAFQATQLDAGGRLLLAGAGGVPGPGGGSGAGRAVSYRGEFRFDHVQLLHAAGLTSADPVVAGTLVVTGANPLGALLRPVDVDVRPGAAPVPPAGGAELDIIASGTITIEAGAKLDMSAKGYAGAFGGNPIGGPPGVAPAAHGGGGSHGGAGSGAGAGEIYDSVDQPALPGGGGGGAWSPPGGGVVHLEAANLVLAGQILANGGAVCNNGAAAGGTVFVALSGTLSGAGTIAAAGASGCGYAYGGAAGGGGRVALLAQGFSGFDPAAQVQAAGGLLDSNPRQMAAAGTLFTKVAGQTYGALRVDAGSPPAGTAPILATVLPAIGRGVIASVTPASGDPASAWIAAQAGTPLFSLGAVGMWVRIAGADYLVTGQSADRTQLLLAGAAGAAVAGAPFVGVYKFDQVTVTGDANVTVSDAVAFAATQVDPGSTLKTLDLLPPVISAIQPAAGTVFTAGQPVAISFSVADDDLAAVTVTFGEQSVTLTAPPFAWTVPAPAVAAASDLPIQIVATDKSANSATATQLVHVLPASAAGPPAVALACPTTGAMLAPGTSLQLAATAAEASGIEKVELLLGSATTPLAKLFSPPYVFAFTPPAGATDGQVLHVRVRATSFGDTTAEAAADFTVVTGNVLTASTAIAAGNAQYDGASLIVAGGTVTIDGPHTFRDLVVLDGATVNHSPTTAAQENHLAVNLTRNLYVACGGAVDVTGLGYLGGPSGSAHAWGYGNTPAEGAAPAGAGGSHGGRGGRYDGSSPVYGSFWNPQDPGAGGGWAGGSPSGASGGGVVTLAAGGAGLIDGAVRASGGQRPQGGAGGGAGGSVRITAAALAGAGAIQALGGAPTAWPDPNLTGGGSGGRIALFGASIDAGLLSRTSAAGAAGTATDPSTWGAAGTVFTKLDANPYGDLIIDNAGIASSQYTELLSVGAGTVTAVAATSFTDSQADFHHDLSGIDVVFNGNLGALYPIVSHVHHGQTLNLQVAAPPLSAAIQPGATYGGVYNLGNLAVRGGAQAIAVDAVTTANPPQVASGASWTPAYAGTVAITSPAAGATLTAGAPLTVSADVADLLGVSRVLLAVAGGGSVTLTSPPYTWSTNAPAVATATDEAVTATVFAAGGNYLSASVTVHVDPAVDPLAPAVALTCWHDQDLVTAGIAIPISFTVSDAQLVSSYSLVVNGVTVQTVNANQAAVAASLNWTPPAGTAPGTSFTVSVTATNPAGHVGSATIHLVAASASALGGNLTLGSSYASQSLVLGAGTFTVPAALSLNALTLMNGARVVGMAGTPLHLTVAGTLTVECGGAIDVSALGYLGATADQSPGAAPPGVRASQVDAGGSHGGLGVNGPDFHGPAGDVYDSVYVPQLGGGGASNYTTSEGTRGGNGGGAVSLTAGTLQLYGQILAQGEGSRQGSPVHSGGSGGAVLVHAGTLAGSGAIDASGGASDAYGAGGGGRVALYVTTFSGFDPTAQAVARGGALTASGQVVGHGGAGTVYWQDGGATYGRLLLDSGKDGSGHDQVGPATPLPALGGGGVTAWSAAGGDAWMTAAAAFGQPWLGAWAAVSDAAGNLLGEFQVSQIDAQGRALLAGAGAVQGAARFQGEYRFDRIDLQSSAGLGGSDPIQSGDVEVYGAAARLPAAQLTAASMTLNAGTVVTPAAGGALQLSVTGQLTIQSGARIDVSALGYLGATADNTAGTAPPAVNPSQVDAGGSHGGPGMKTSGHPGPAGEVYDSVYLPQLGGGGASIYSTSYGARGGNGGGTVNLTAGTLQLDGQILAKGEPWNQPGSLARAGGAGGAVVVHAGALAGAGAIDVSGGAADGAGSGGGGRVALYVTGSQAFATASQVKAQGGALTSGGALVAYAGPGTVLDRQPGQTYGSLRVDGGSPPAGTPIATTSLPAIGPGTIGSVAPVTGDPTSVWIAAQAGTPLFSLGAAGMWVRIDGTDYPVTGQSADRTQLLLQGAAGAAAAGQHFFGVYKFDQVTVTGDAAVQASDALIAGSTQVDPGATLTGPDLLPPAISGIQPAAGTVYTAGQPVAISATVTDDDLATVTIGFGEQSVTLAAPPFAWTVPAPPVAAASDVPIQVSAVDAHGNTATATQLVHVLPATASGPPAVAIACPTAGAMLAPGTTLSLTATASETSGIDKVELFLGSATTPLAKLFSPPYTLAFTPPAGATDGQLLHLRVRATSFGNTTAEAAVDVTAVTGNVLTAATAIAAGNTAYDGASLIVAGAGATVTIDGPHTFRDLVVLDGGVVNHSPTSAAQENHLAVTLTRNLYVSCGGAIDVTGRGYLGGASASAHAYGYGNTTTEGAAPTGAGGSFGGRGGRYDGSSPVYGSFWNPQDPGAGGGWASGTPSGANGGGVVVVNATGTGIVDGAVRANGGQHPGGGTGGTGGGAGGSVILNVASLAGAGVIQALGGPPTAVPSPAQTGGGAGGRIALYGNAIDAGLLSRTLAAGAAGSSTDPSTWGAAGTVFAKLDANAYGDLIVDNAGVASSQITELLAVGSGTVTAIGSNTMTDSLADFHHDLSGIDVLFNGNAGALYPILANAHHGQTLTLQVAAPPLSGAIQPGAAYSGTYTFRNVTVRGGAQVVTADAVSATNAPQVASGSTWTPGYAGSIQITSPAAGATFTAGSPMTVSAGVTDVLGVSRVVFSAGGQSFTASAPPYTWSSVAPGGSAPADFAITATAYGSSGNHFSTSITIHSSPGVDPQAPVVTIACPRTGALVAAGSTIPISFTIADATQVSSYSLIVNGTVVQTVTASQATVSASLNWTVPPGTPAGNSFTVQISAVNPGGHIGYGNVTLVTASSSALTGNVSLGSSYSGQALVLGAGTFTVPAALSLSSLTLMNGARVVGVQGQPLNLTVSGTLTVQCGATIDAGALGYAGGTVNSWVSGTAPAGVAVSKFDAGGSHGGAGKVYSFPGPAGAVYDSVYLPQLGGGGGSMICSGGSNHGGSGGGVVTLTVGILQLDGQILARGESRPAGQAGGAGGSVVVTAATVAGAGSIDASGGAGDAGCYGSGPGGGGRVALYATAFQGFDPTSQVLAQGANQLNNGTVVAGAFGGPGTIFWKDGNATYGRLLVDSGKDGNGNDRMGPLTPLPALGSGAVTAWTAAAGPPAGAWLTAATPFGQAWLGAWVAVTDASGTLLGEFQVSQIDAQGRLLLAGAGAVTGAATYQGEYRFDRIDLKSGAGLTASDPLKSGDLEVYGQSTRLPAQLTTASMTVNAGAVATAAVAGAINLTVTGTLNVQAGARIDLSAQGYLGGTVNSWVSGTAPPGVAVSKYDAGGSHGGAGNVYHYAGPAGTVYDSVYLPQLAGGGGSMICSGGTNHGGSGGGVVTLTLGALQLDGQILARGETRPSGQAGGAGGSVVVTAATVAGAGSIDVSGGGGDGGCYGSGTGGGGRVALYVTNLGAFSPTTQILAQGGTQLVNGAVVPGVFGGPGTIYWKDVHATYGRLLVDSGKDGSGNDRLGPLTPLPALGSGAVTAWTVQGGSSGGALLTAAASFGQVWLGAWVAVTDASGTLLGEFQVSQIDGQGRLLLAGAGAVTGAATYQGEYRFDRIDLKSSAGLTASDPLKSGDFEVYGQSTRLPAQLTTTSMTVNAGSVATAAVSGTINLTVTGTLDVQPGATLDVSALGYLGGTVNNNTPGLAPPGVAVSQYDAGGSHGGAGNVYHYAGPAGTVYDSVYLPQLAGGGGSMICSGGTNHGGSGGGVVTLTLGALQLDGKILARGESRPSGQAGGAGGSVVVTAAMIAGAGSIDVSGGGGDGGCYGSGTGGGGRVALYATTFQGFDPTAQVLAQGGTQLLNGTVVAGVFGGPGTIFWKDGNATYGRLLVDSGKDGSGNDRQGPLTPLPALGSGAVTAWTVQGGSSGGALLTAATPFGQAWLGAWVAVSNAAGTRLGEFLVSQIDAQGRLLLAGAGAMTGTAASFQGEYRFDRIDLKSSAGLTASDPLESGDVEVFGQATRLPAQLTTTSMTVNAGSVATAAVAGAVNLTVTGTLNVQAGAKLDVSALGYLGGTVNNNTPGLAPPGVAVSKYDAGGSHGGAGNVYHYAGPAGAVYDSAYWPLFGGGGGSMICSGGTNHGGSGGGVVTLAVGTLQLDGQILARGESRPSGQAGGAGGSVLVQAATIAGLGSIDASGGTGDGGCYGSGPGGGGRVALIATTFSGFDPTKQALAQGAGQRNNAQVVAGFAGPGTVFWKNGGATYGQLIVDSGQGTTFSQTLPITPLAGIGVATVGTATADAVVPANLWITASGGAAFQLGLIGMWARVNGTDYPVLAQSADLKSLELAGAAGSVAAGAGIRGVYKFDEVDVRGGAKLQFNDTNVVGVWKVDPNSQVIQNVP